MLDGCVLSCMSRCVGCEGSLNYFAAGFSERAGTFRRCCRCCRSADITIRANIQTALPATLYQLRTSRASERGTGVYRPATYDFGAAHQLGCWCQSEHRQWQSKRDRGYNHLPPAFLPENVQHAFNSTHRYQHPQSLSRPRVAQYWREKSKQSKLMTLFAYAPTLRGYPPAGLATA